MADLLIYKDIGRMWDGIDSQEVVAQLRDMGNPDSLNIRINTLGGQIGEAVAIRAQLRKFIAAQQAINPAFKARTFVDGYAYSAGTIIMYNGTDITMAEGSMLMYHQAWDICMGNADEMLQRAANLKQLDLSISDMIAKAVGKEQSEIMAMMKRETYLTAAEAVAQGFVHDTDASAPANFALYPDASNAFKSWKPGDYEKFMRKRAEDKPPNKNGVFEAKARLAVLEMTAEIDE